MKIMDLMVENMSMEILMHDFENDDAPRYESSVYSSQDESNHEESDYDLDDNNEETHREHCCSVFYYNSSHSNVYYVGGVNGRSFTKQLRLNVNRYNTYSRKVVHWPSDDLNALIKGDHFVEHHKYDETYIDQFVDKKNNMLHVYSKIEGLYGTMIIHNKSFIKLQVQV